MGHRQKRTTKLSVYLFALLNLATLNTALASEILYYLVNRDTWRSLDKKASFRPASFAQDGYIELLPKEQIVATAQARYREQTDLLLLRIEIPFTDSHLTWENRADKPVSWPHYFGELPRNYVTNVYTFKPNKDGTYRFPADSFLTRIVNRTIPDATVDLFLDYQNWQKTNRLYKRQKRNFARPSVQLQWWYFDFFLTDGSSVVLAFIPQGWWSDVGNGKKGLLTIALKTKEGAVKRFTKTIPQSDIKSSAERLEVLSNLVIESTGSKTNRRYSIRVNFPEVTGVFTMTPTRPPFAAYPTGAMPGILMTLMSGADWGSPSFSYVSQIPNSTVAGSLAWDDYRRDIAGHGYHEQGRLNDTPERQGGSWTWYHFMGEGWSIFGSPGSYIYLQQGDQVVRSGFHLMSRQYTLQNRTFSSPDHPKILTGGEILFHHNDITFRLTIDPATSRTLVSYAATTNPNQVWGTVGGPATLSISDGSSTKTLAGRMFLETCSWETRKEH